MHRFLLIGLFMLPSFGLQGAEPQYPRDVTKWQEVEVPRESLGARMVWFYAANYSHFDWRVFSQDGKPSADHGKNNTARLPNQPKFNPAAGKFRGASAFAAVEDGWLVGFNLGEFGAALYWFSRDGKQNYKISDHQVVEFFPLPDGVHAIEGLAHLTMSKGSVIRVGRAKTGARWQAILVAELPFAPYTLSLRRDGTMLITLSDALVSIGSDRKVRTLLADAPWKGFLHPNSSILSPDERTLYIGMRQFVGEFELTTNRFRFLIPSKDFLNKLPKADEERIRKQYSD